MPMPSGMRVYAPHIPNADDAAAVKEATLMLERVAAACTSVARGGVAASFDLATLSSGRAARDGRCLGQGKCR